jgi:two-component system cell cycle response regulator CpdR
MAQILIAEDDESMRRFLARALTQAGHDVMAVGDGAEAADRLNETDFDLLLADVVMPGMDGIELARRAIAEKPGIRVMFITGFAAVALRNRYLSPAGTKVLSKPFHLRDLVDEVDRLLDG